jgi:hypothetical protein
MTSAVISILSSIDRLSPDEQQEMILELLEKMSGDERLESMGLAAEFHGLERAGMRSVLMAKLRSGLEQVQQGRVVDGETVFDRLRERLVQMGQ